MLTILKVEIWKYQKVKKQKCSKSRSFELQKCGNGEKGRRRNMENKKNLNEEMETYQMKRCRKVENFNLEMQKS